MEGRVAGSARSVWMAEKTEFQGIGDSALDHLLVEGLSEYAIFVVNPAGAIVRWNLGAQGLFGYSGGEIIGRHFRLLFTPEDVAAGEPERELADALRGPKAGHDRWHVRKDGSRFWGMNTAQPLYDERGACLGFTKIVRDLSERYLATAALRESEQRLRVLVEETQHASLHDDLTGLANKPLFREYLARAAARSERRPRSTFAVLFLDLDRFKAVNDSVGHVLADRLLVQAANRLERAIRTEDVLARCGGDEFAILLEDINGTSDAIVTAERILESFRAPFTIEGDELSTSASIGIAVVSNHEALTSSADRILENADLAMYEAKSKGRARYAVFHDGMRVRAREALQLNKDLREALERGEMRIFYQPIVAVGNRKINGFEALVRWQHPQRGLLLPADFRAKAEETGLIVGIDRWALTEAARQLSIWRREFDGHLTMSLNLSAREFERPNLAAELHEVLTKAALPPQAVAVEIAEALTVENCDRFVALLKEIRAAGLDLQLDDFGTGHSSFIYLSQLPLSALKIGESFMSGLGSGGRNVAVVRAMAALARSLGLKCIAEGVETEDQCAALSKLGCGEAQGRLFSEPVPADDACALLARA